MKRALLILLIILSGSVTVFSQQDTTTKNPNLQGIGTAPIAKTKTSDPISYTVTVKDVNEVRDSLKNISAKVSLLPKSTCKYDQPNEPEGGEWFLIFLPAIIFALVGSVFALAVKGFSFVEALKENELTKITVPNPFYKGVVVAPGSAEVPLTMEVTPNVSYKPAILANPPAVPPAVAIQPEYEIKDADKSYRPSISRYIALISSLLIIIIAVCMSCFFIYHYIRTGCPPELGALTTVILALGIGIVPYAANKVSGAISAKSNES